MTVVKQVAALRLFLVRNSSGISYEISCLTQPSGWASTANGVEPGGSVPSDQRSRNIVRRTLLMML